LAVYVKDRNSLFARGSKTPENGAGGKEIADHITIICYLSSN